MSHTHTHTHTHTHSWQMPVSSCCWAFLGVKCLLLCALDGATWTMPIKQVEKQVVIQLVLLLKRKIHHSYLQYVCGYTLIYSLTSFVINIIPHHRESSLEPQVKACIRFVCFIYFKCFYFLFYLRAIHYLLIHVSKSVFRPAKKTSDCLVPVKKANNVS